MTRPQVWGLSDNCQFTSLRTWLRRYRRHRARIFRELDPATGHWRRL